MSLAKVSSIHFLTLPAHKSVKKARLVSRFLYAFVGAEVGFSAHYFI